MKLREADRLILELRDNEGLTLQEIGQRMGLTKQRIHQIEERARMIVRLAEMAKENPLLKLSARAKRVIADLEVTSIEDLSGVNYDTLMKMRHCGEKTADEIIDLMIENGIQVGISYGKEKKKSAQEPKKRSISDFYEHNPYKNAQ